MRKGKGVENLTTAKGCEATKTVLLKKRKTGVGGSKIFIDTSGLKKKRFNSIC